MLQKLINPKLLVIVGLLLVAGIAGGYYYYSQAGGSFNRNFSDSDFQVQMSRTLSRQDSISFYVGFRYVNNTLADTPGMEGGIDVYYKKSTDREYRKLTSVAGTRNDKNNSFVVARELMPKTKYNFKLVGRLYVPYNSISPIIATYYGFATTTTPVSTSSLGNYSSCMSFKNITSGVSDAYRNYISFTYNTSKCGKGQVANSVKVFYKRPYQKKWDVLNWTGTVNADQKVTIPYLDLTEYHIAVRVKQTNGNYFYSAFSKK